MLKKLVLKVAVGVFATTAYISATAGTVNVTDPLVSPDKTTELIFSPYRITQRLPGGIVTDLLDETVIGPALMALLPVVIV